MKLALALLAVLAALLLLSTGCKYALAPVLWVYEIGHPPAECADPLPGDGRGYQCDFTDAGTRWLCTEPSATMECDGGARSAMWWPRSGNTATEDITDLDGGP